MKKIFAILMLISMSVFAADEDIDIGTYYPSPKGLYDTVEIYNRTDTETLEISAEGILKTNTTDSNKLTAIDPDGDLITPKLDLQGDRLFTPALHANEVFVSDDLKINGTNYNLPILVPGSTNNTHLALAPIFGKAYYVAECPTAIQNVRVGEGVNPVCIVIPIPTSPPFAIAICTGEESFLIQYDCLELSP